MFFSSLSWLDFLSWQLYSASRLEIRAIVIFELYLMFLTTCLCLTFFLNTYICVPFYGHIFHRLALLDVICLSSQNYDSISVAFFSASVQSCITCFWICVGLVAIETQALVYCSLFPVMWCPSDMLIPLSHAYLPLFAYYPTPLPPTKILQTLFKLRLPFW